jgi:hypothetical protein
LDAQPVWPRTGEAGQVCNAETGEISPGGGGSSNPREMKVGKKKLTAIVCSTFTQLYRHAIKVIAHLLEARCEDTERMIAFEPEQQDDNLFAAGAVGREVAVLVADLRGGLLEDDAVHGWVAEEAERDKVPV